MFTVIITGNSTKTLRTKTLYSFEDVEDYVDRVMAANSSRRCYWYTLDKDSYQIDVLAEDEDVQLVN